MRKDYTGMSPVIAQAMLELDAMRDFYERTGKSYFDLSPTEKRKLLENYKEDHQ